MTPLQSHYKLFAFSLIAALLIVLPPASAAASETPGDDAAVWASVCPVVFPLDQFPTEQGYHYFFYGNAFFINEQGYLLTAAHIVKPFRDGGRPSILVAAPDGSRRLQEAELVAEDWDHDVAILKATPNPFAGRHNTAFMPLTVEKPSLGKPVVAASLFPSDLNDSHTSEDPVEIRSQGKVIDYQFHAETQGSDSELLLFDQQIVPGQSGSPVFSADSRQVVGVVVGQWLHPTVIHSGNSGHPLVMSPGAALRIHYAIALLRKNNISWHAAAAPATPTGFARQESGFSPPAPVSLVATPYPPQALFGGEVVLDARIDTDGRIAELSVVHGIAPYLDPVLDAVRTWIFSPAQLDGRAVEARLGIVVQFPQSFRPKLTTPERKYGPPPEELRNHAALPVFTVEPNYPLDTMAEDSVILYGLVNRQGQIVSTQVLRDIAALTDPTLAALQQWRFTPAKQAGVDTDSGVIVVTTFRHP
jgi:Trypsin-like peptidase domain/Gram-negative bacterial TonB protein C-terminal